METATRNLVRQRAGFCCEYCQLAEANSPVARPQVEHVRPKKHGGSDHIENLALACIDCNLRKGVNLTGIDDATGDIVILFNPRTQSWADHFLWSGLQIVGRTAVGRATIAVLTLNSPDRMQVRMSFGLR
jgi:hypothetical protein